MTTRDLINHTITSSLVTTELMALVSSISTVQPGRSSAEQQPGNIRRRSGLSVDLGVDRPLGHSNTGCIDGYILRRSSRGEHGSESKYLIQFSSPTLSAVAHAVVRVNIGKAVYLRLN